MKVTSRECLKLTHHQKKPERARAVAGILSLEETARLRALVIALRSRHQDVRLPVIHALGAVEDDRAVKPLLRALRVALAGGNPQSVYIAQTNQIAYVQDFDVEVA